jgi:hypothetical protein
MTDRACAYCCNPLPAGKRLDALYCDGLCRGRAHRARRGNRSETATNAFPAESAGPRERRPSRNGKGIHVYLLPSEIDRIIRDFDVPMQSAAMAIESKLIAARKRIRQRGRDEHPDPREAPIPQGPRARQ